MKQRMRLSNPGVDGQTIREKTVTLNVGHIKRFSMKRGVFFCFLFSTLCFPSNGQIREILDNGEVLEYYSGMVFETLGESMYSYRFIYGRYPEDKQALLDFHLEKAKVEEHVLFHGLILDFENGSVEFEYYDDSLYTALLAKRDSLITADLNDPENVLTVSGDTCTFTYAKATRDPFYYGFDESVPTFKLRAIQCIGGPGDLQKKDYRSFRQHIQTLAYDKNGRCLWSLCSEAPYLPREVDWKFRYVVSRDPGDYPDGDGSYGLARPVLIPVTITRNGMLNYDVSCLDGLQLYCRGFYELGSTADSRGTIMIEEALDSDYLDTIKTYTKAFFDKHEEVDRMELWELLLFNKPPECSKDTLTGLRVLHLNEIDTPPLCNGVSFPDGFLSEYIRRFHPENDNPYRYAIQFVIDKNGKLLAPRFRDKTSDMLNPYEKQILERVNQMQDWEPGRDKGDPVDVFITVPVIY